MFHFIQRVERQRHALQHLAPRQVAKIPGGQVGHQGEPDIGGGGAMCDGGLRYFLIIIRGKPVFFCRGKGLKEGPDFAARLTQQLLLVRIQ